MCVNLIYIFGETCYTFPRVELTIYLRKLPMILYVCTVGVNNSCVGVWYQLKFCSFIQYCESRSESKIYMQMKLRGSLICTAFKVPFRFCFYSLRLNSRIYIFTFTFSSLKSFKRVKHVAAVITWHIFRSLSRSVCKDADNYCKIITQIRYLTWIPFNDSNH